MVRADARASAAHPGNTDAFHALGEQRGVYSLSGGDHGGQDVEGGVHGEVELGGQAPAQAANRLVVRLGRQPVSRRPARLDSPLFASPSSVLMGPADGVPSKTCRRSLGGRPIRAVGGNSGCSSAHCSSVGSPQAVPRAFHRFDQRLQRAAALSRRTLSFRPQSAPQGSTAPHPPAWHPATAGSAGSRVPAGSGTDWTGTTV